MIGKRLTKLSYGIYLIIRGPWLRAIETLKFLGKFNLRTFSDLFFSAFKYGASFDDFLNFKFYNLSPDERYTYATTALMYDFHNRCNPKSRRFLIDDKGEFEKTFYDLSPDSFIVDVRTLSEAMEWIALSNQDGVVVKDTNGRTGKGVTFHRVLKTETETLLDGKPGELFLKEERRSRGKIILQRKVIQHESLSNLAPRGLNTIRVITKLDNERSKVCCLGAALRLTTDGPLDNFSAGNLAASVCTQSGLVNGPGFYKQTSRRPYVEKHPISGMTIRNFQIPKWQQVIELVEEAALRIPELRSVGWDVAVTNDGAVLIEGNTTWNKDTWQIPAQVGKRELLDC